MSFDYPIISSEEVFNFAIRRLRGTSKAPGPDGIPGKVWLLTLPLVISWLLRLFNDCFRSGIFPKQWKVACLVLLKKPNRLDGKPSLYRPLCLIDDLGKIFEKIIADRMVRYLDEIRPNLSPMQFGFRKGHSTLDAVARIRSLAKEVVSRGGVALAVSIDIVNAFNSLSWDAIREAIVRFGFPSYLRTTIDNYLHDRYLNFVDRTCTLRSEAVYCGVPQGSVLGHSCRISYMIKSSRQYYRRTVSLSATQTIHASSLVAEA